jgi:hypothetical protein
VTHKASRYIMKCPITIYTVHLYEAPQEEAPLGLNDTRFSSPG